MSRSGTFGLRALLFRMLAGIFVTLVAVFLVTGVAALSVFRKMER